MLNLFQNGITEMITIKSGDILCANVEAVVNTVNCVGIMGKGIALQFKFKYPDNFSFYKKVCDSGKMIVGKVLVFKREATENPKYIINFPTKRHWKGKSKIEDIVKGLDSLIKVVKEENIKSIAIPALGSGLGGLDWSLVKPIVIDAFSDLEGVDVQLFEPFYNPKPENIEVNTKKPKITIMKALLIKLMQIYNVLDYRYTKLEIQKLLYFLNILRGDELKLKFEKSNYGPFTNTVNHILRDMEYHYIRGLGDGSSRSEIQLLSRSIEDADKLLEEHEEYKESIERIQKLIDGFETPFGMELLSTVHWVVKYECEDSEKINYITDAVHRWNKRKKDLFKSNHIEVAISRLKEQKWI